MGRGEDAVPARAGAGDPFEGVPRATGVTLDGSATTVRDDGFSVRRLPDGGFSVAVAIVRAETACPFGGEVDAGARLAGRGTVIRMLPPEVIAAASLDPGETRDALLVTHDVGPDGAPRGLRVGRAAFTSLAALDARDASTLLRRPGSDPLAPMLLAARDAAVALRRRREGGDVAGVAPTDVVREFAVLTNRELALACAAAGLSLVTSADPAEPYARFTSPLRRYEDVVNQRVLEDGMAGRPPRHPPAEVAGLSDELLAAALVRLKATQDVLGRHVAAGKGRRLLVADAPWSYARATPSEFMMAVRAAREAGGPTAAMLADGIRRLDDVSLTLQTILALSHADAGFARRASDRVGALAANPEDDWPELRLKANEATWTYARTFETLSDGSFACAVAAGPVGAATEARATGATRGIAKMRALAAVLGAWADGAARDA